MIKRYKGFIKRNKFVNSKKVSPIFSFKKKPALKSNLKVVRRSNFNRSFVTFFLLLIVSFITIYFAIVAYRYVVMLRSSENIASVETVFGFEIPSYPGSENVFKDKDENDTVKKFVTSGYSVYRLPKDTLVSEVFNYYNSQLPSLGWSYVGFVDLTSEEKMYGQYWTKGEKGLRIYSRINDVWYQHLSKEQAESGLEDLVKKETARKLLLLTSEKSELLPDFPWRLSYPTEYKVKYYGSEISSLQSISFQKIGSNNIIFFEPQGYYGANSFENYIEKAISRLNKVRKERWQLSSSKELHIKGNLVLRGEIVNGKKQGYSLALNNSVNNVVYVITTLNYNDPFFDYILNNIKVSSSPL